MEIDGGRGVSHSKKGLGARSQLAAGLEPSSPLREPGALVFKKDLAGPASLELVPSFPLPFVLPLHLPPPTAHFALPHPLLLLALSFPGVCGQDGESPMGIRDESNGDAEYNGDQSPPTFRPPPLSPSRDLLTSLRGSVVNTRPFWETSSHRTPRFCRGLVHRDPFVAHNAVGDDEGGKWGKCGGGN